MCAIGRHVSKLSGYAPALPTPFNDEGSIDSDAFERLCDLQIANGATALVVCCLQQALSAHLRRAPSTRRTPR
jgi:dihydrodipicolinate synthase/N-acetylneuraminate lyase